jgi:CHAT domain-containing protein/tetratricopeptide (TPR) repeat protein
MKGNPEEQNKIKEYLLGQLTDEAKRRQIEEKLFLDDDYAEKLSIAEAELTEEYLDGNLSGEDRRSFDEFFLAAPERKKHLQLIKNLHKYAAQSQAVKEFPEERKALFDWRGWFAVPALRLAFVALIVCGIGFAVYRLGFSESEAEKGLTQLQIAYRGQRPVESRLTANFDYAPFVVTRGGEEPPIITDPAARKSAERLLGDASENSSDARAHHALGVFYLAEKKFDEALKEFNRALENAPENAKIYSDRGAVYLEKAQLAKDANRGEEFFVNANLGLQNLNRALELDENLLEALFNRALLLRKIPQMTNQAREAWKKYLEKDSSSRWADEARRELDELTEQSSATKDKSQILKDFLEAFRQGNDRRTWEIASQTKELISGIMISRQLARNFLEASVDQSRKEEQNEILSAFVYLGELERQNAGDPYFAELAGYYSKTNQAQRQKLLDAHAAMQKGYELILKLDYLQGLEAFEQAKKLFEEAGDDWEAGTAEYQICYCLCQRVLIKESNRRLLALVETSEKKKYKWQQALAEGWAGSNYIQLGEYSQGIVYSGKSLDLAEEISDTYNIQRALVQLTDVNGRIRDSQKTLDYAYRGLIFQSSYHSFPRQKWRNMNFAVEALSVFGFNEAAAALGEEMLNLAETELKDPRMTNTSRKNLAIIYGKLQRLPQAFRQSDAILQFARSSADEKMKQKLIADSTRIRADLQRESGDCAQALENYNQARELYRQMEFSASNYLLEKGRLFCEMARKNDAAVKAELLEVLQMFDESRGKIKEESERNTFFDAEQGVYDAAIDYSHSQLKDSAQAFDYAENSRARSLLNRIHNNFVQPLNVSEIRRRMPPGVQMIYYAVLADKILIWQVSEAKFVVAEKQIKAVEIEEKVRKYMKLLLDKNDAKEFREAAKELYGILIAPVEATLEPDKTLCLVADKMFFRIPFAALVAPQTDKYLIEEYALVSAPSATVFVNETEIARRKADDRQESVLSIGNPAFSRGEYAGLKDLPAAAREARQIGAFYEPRKILVESQATKEQLINNLDEADVLHFAGHYVPNANSPAASKFVLSEGGLSVEEITKRPLSRTRLVILSACETGVERFYNGEGMIGAARAFLALDVPLVVASQWSVDSKASAELMINFHRYRKQKDLPTVAALRQAQIDILSNEKSPFRQPFYWAGFLPIGGYTVY